VPKGHGLKVVQHDRAFQHVVVVPNLRKNFLVAQGGHDRARGNELAMLNF